MIDLGKLDPKEIRTVKLSKGKDGFMYRLHDDIGSYDALAVCFNAAEALEWPESDVVVKIRRTEAPGYTFVCGEWDEEDGCYTIHVGINSTDIFESSYAPLHKLVEKNPDGFYYRVIAA